MRFRTLGKSGLTVSEVGLGCEHLQGQDAEAVCAVVDEALRQDINILDVFMSEPQVRTDLGAALKGRRERAVLQGHIGSAWLDGQYCRTRRLDEAKHAFEDFLKRLDTDYVDIGMLHFVDTQGDYDALMESGLVEYAQSLKDQGVVKAVGLSSHEPLAARRAVEAGFVDVLMFSINPAFDLVPEGVSIEGLLSPETFRGGGLSSADPAREQLYRTCESLGVGITVMKALGAGTLLSAEASPFGAALTPAQCMHYALTRPAVSSVLIGCRTPEEVRAAAAYETATDAQRDYSEVLAGAGLYAGAQGRCMYCNHCHPCPARIDVAAVNRCLDLALAGGGEVPPAVRAHYGALAAHGSDCIACGQCEERCPFHVSVSARMARAAALFGK
ncbi:aldo/keto reductase [Pseudoflavonifractor sp. BIOML-A11]|nr:aldo/keto reductase [Pseudoflavonifractor sp. BIOML-A11]MTR47927.1 aldo/keto reductase [Pseudoflavonifractor sp. BIOML-A11]